MKLEEEIINAIQDGYIYDWIANNYYRLDNELLKDLLLEYIWLVNENKLNDSSIVKELVENWRIYD